MTVEQFILDLDDPQKSIMQYLDDLLREYPEITPKIRYGIPFYYRKSWICYLNPIKDQGVELAFTRGNELSNAQGILQDKGRKQVMGMEVFGLSEVPVNELRQVVQEAIILDESVPYASKRRKL